MRIRDINFHIRVLFLPLFFVGGLTVLCQNVEKDTIPELSRQLEETVVVSSTPAKKIKSATPIYTVDKTSIIRTGIKDIADAIHRLPGVTLRDYGGAGGLKTVSVRGLGASHTAVSYDGLPLSDAQTGAIDMSRYSMDNTDNLSLIIGDNDELFISARAAASPANLMLRTPLPAADKPFDLTARFKAGSFGYLSPYVNMSGILSENTVLNITGEYVHAKNNYPFKWVNGQVITKERRENNRMNSGHVETNVFWKDSAGHSLSGKIYYYDNDRQLPGPVLYYNVNNSKEHLRERNAFGQTEFITPLGDKWKLRAAGKFNWAASLYKDYGTRQSGNYEEENYFQREYYLTANILFRPIPQWTFDYSADYVFNNLNSNLVTDSRPYRNGILQSLTAKWSIPRINITARLIESTYLNGVGRDSYVAPKNRNRLSPSFTASARLLNSGMLYGRISYKNIFRMPTFNEAFFNHYGSPDLKPESTDQWNIGLTGQFGIRGLIPQLTVTADFYHNKVKNQIVAIPYNMFIWTVTNVEGVRVNGADVTLNTTIDLGRRQQLVASGTWSYQRARISVDTNSSFYGKQVAYTPLNSGSFSLGYENPWVNMVIHGQGVSARYADNSNSDYTRIPGYFEFGVTAWKRFEIRKLKFEIRLDIMNILNKQYFVIARYPMPGRAWQTSLKFNI